MTETREFPTAEVLSATVGILMCEIGKVYEVLNFMTGESLYTHQLPRVGREALAVLRAAHPALEETIAEREQVNTSNWKEWRDRWVARHGPTMSVPRMSRSEHEAIDPVSELAEHVHPDRVIIVGGAQ